jgi:hypothetical protein
VDATTTKTEGNSAYRQTKIEIQYLPHRRFAGYFSLLKVSFLNLGLFSQKEVFQ